MVERSNRWIPPPMTVGAVPARDKNQTAAQRGGAGARGDHGDMPLSELQVGVGVRVGGGGSGAGGGRRVPQGTAERVAAQAHAALEGVVSTNCASSSFFHPPRIQSSLRHSTAPGPLPSQRDKFEDMLRGLTVERTDICAAMAFALDNAESGGQPGQGGG